VDEGEEIKVTVDGSQKREKEREFKHSTTINKLSFSPDKKIVLFKEK